MSTRPWIVDDDLWALIEPLLPPWPDKAPGPRPVPDHRQCLQGILYVLHNDIAWQLLPLEPGVRLGPDLLAAARAVAEGRDLRPAAPDPARQAKHGRRAGLVQSLCGRLPRPREKGGADTGPSPVDRRKTGSKHHLICDGRGTPLKVITTAANVNDVTQPLPLVDSIPPVAGRPGRPRRRPQAPLGDGGYDSDPNRRELRTRRILPVTEAPQISRAWASSATSSSRPSRCSTPSSDSPSDGNAAPSSTMPASPSPAASSATDGSRGQSGGCPGAPSTRPFATHPSRAPDDPGRVARCR